MESKKVDSRMDVAALTGSDSNYFDTQDYVFIRPTQSNHDTPSTHPLVSQTDNPAGQATAAPLNNGQDKKQEPQQDQDEQASSNPATTESAPPTTSKCTLSYCCICTQGLPASFQSPPTWSEVCRVAMYALELGHKDRKYFHIRKEICPFIEAHYEILVPKTKSISWRQTVNMTLSHPQYAHIFMQESQDHEYGRRKVAGYYCLRQHIDLYKIPEPEKKTRRKRYFDEASTKKKGTKNDDDDSAPNSDGSDHGQTTTNTTSQFSDFRLDTPANTTSTSTTTSTDSSNGATAEEAGDDPDKPNKKGLIKKLETDLFLYFLERKSLPNSEDENLENPTLPPLTTLSPQSSLGSTPLPSIPTLTSATVKNTNLTASDSTALPPLHSAIPNFNTAPLSKSAPSTTPSLRAPSPPPPHPAPKAISSVTQLINNDESRRESSPLFSQWHTKSGKAGPLENSSVVNWKREPPDPQYVNSSAFSPQKAYSSKYDLDPSGHEYSQPFTPSKFPPTSGRPPSPILNKPSPSHFGGLSHMLPPPPPPLPPHQQKRSGSPISWQYEQSPQTSFHQYSPPQYPPPPPSPYSSSYSHSHSHPPPYHFSPSPYQKGPLPHPHDQPLPPLPYSSSSSSSQPPNSTAPSQTPIQIHQSPLQQKQQQQQQQKAQQQVSPSSSSSSSSTSSSPPSASKSPTAGGAGSAQAQAQANLQTQQPQRRNRLTTRPWERAILEDYYISFFCQSRHSRREKVKVDELVKKLGWEISRIQRWLDNRRTKDRPRFGHPEFNVPKNDEEEGGEENNKAKKVRRQEGSSPASPSPSLSPLPNTASSSSSASKSPASITKNNNNNNKNVKKITNNKRKGSTDSGDSEGEEDPCLSPSSSSSSSSLNLTPTKKKKSVPPSSSSSTPLPPNPNQANTDFWVIKNK